MKTRVLVVDDSPLIRMMIRDIVSSESDMEVIGIAKDGNEALTLAEQLKPDVITMDVEMPNRNGLSTLAELMKTNPRPVIMVSTLTSKGTAATMEALHLGAVDFVCKPNNGSIKEFRNTKDELVEKIRAARNARVGQAVGRTIACKAPSTTDKVVVIASSTGGPKALAALWQQLPQGLPAPILIVQHMPPGFTESLAARLNSLGTVPCREAKPGDVIKPGVALMAPGGKHMRVGAKGELTFDEAPPIHGVRPAADYLFHSALDFYGNRLVGVVLTGMGRDGAAGAKAIKDAGGVVFGESAATCTVYGMPKAAMEAGGITSEFPISEIGAAIVASLNRRLANAS